jgi:hypothetical protein
MVRQSTRYWLRADSPCFGVFEQFPCYSLLVMSSGKLDAEYLFGRTAYSC